MNPQFLTGRLIREALQLWDTAQRAVVRLEAQVTTAIAVGGEKYASRVRRSFNECKKALRAAGSHPSIQYIDECVVQARKDTVGQLTVRAEDAAAKCGVTN